MQDFFLFKTRGYKKIDHIPVLACNSGVWSVDLKFLYPQIKCGIPCLRIIGFENHLSANRPVSLSVIREVEKKCRLIEIPHGYTLEKALISRFGPDETLVEFDYFHHYVNGNDFFQ